MSSVDGGAAGSWIDAHIHVDHYDEAQREALLERAFAAGAAAVVAVSMHLQSSIVNRGLAQAYPARVHPAYGFHPEQPIPSSQEMDDLFAWIRARHAEGERFAIGEVGLPYYTRTEAEAAGQPFDERPYLALLERFAELAAQLERPIVLHAVYEDADKACDILESYGLRRAHFHWFKGSEATVRRMIAAGYYISATPDIAYEAEIRALAEQYPLSLLMAETDGPWPFEGPYEGRMTEPAMSQDVAVHIAAVKQLPEELVRTVLLQNTKRLYEL